MGMAADLGVDDLEAPLMVAAQAAWPRWCAADTGLAVVTDLMDLANWTRGASRSQANDVLARLAKLTAPDPDARTVLIWLLVPGAIRVADGLRDLHPDIDALVAGQLWIEASRAHELSGRGIAAAILGRTRRAVAAELGVGDLAKRRDRIWAESIRVDSADDLVPVGDGWESGDDLFDQVTLLMIEAMEAHAIHVFDAWLLGTLAQIAARDGVPGHRGRMGLTTPAVIDELAYMVHLSPRAIRRRVATALDRWAEYVAVRDNPARFAVWRAQHTSCPVTAAEEMELVLTEDDGAHFFRVRDLPPDAWAPDVDPERRRRATG